MRFDGDVAIVTDGVSGIGAAVVRMLVARGARVLFAYQDRSEAAAAVVADCVGLQGQVVGHAAALLSDQSAAAALVATAYTTWQRVDILINTTQQMHNAGIMEATMQEWQTSLQHNLHSVYWTTKAVLKPMMKARYGRIVNVTGLQAVAGSHGQAAYAGAAGGILGLTRALAREAAPWSITVNAVVTGLVDDQSFVELPTQVQHMGLTTAALGRSGTPAEIAYPIVFMASRGASYITGQSLAVDGGWMMA